MNRLKNLRKNKKDIVPEAPELPAAPEVPDVDELKEAAEGAVPGNMKWTMFKMWVVSKFSCCLGSPEMPMMGAVDVPDVDIPEVDIPDAPAMPKIGGL